MKSRLIAADLRTEAVRAGMVDLDGLKLIDLTGIRLDDNDKVIGGRKLMADLATSQTVAVRGCHLIEYLQSRPHLNLFGKRPLWT